jgi:hypothetical protein
MMNLLSDILLSKLSYSFTERHLLAFFLPNLSALPMKNVCGAVGQLICHIASVLRLKAATTRAGGSFGRAGDEGRAEIRPVIQQLPILKVSDNFFALLVLVHNILPSKVNFMLTETVG